MAAGISACVLGVERDRREGKHERGGGEGGSLRSRGVFPSEPFASRHLPCWPRIIAENHYDIYNVGGNGRG